MATATITPTKPTTICPRCGAVFASKRTGHGWKIYCSVACNLGAQSERLRSFGPDNPQHGGRAAEKRRASLAQRRAAGELLGRQLQNARLGHVAAHRVSHAQMPPPLPDLPDSEPLAVEMPHPPTLRPKPDGVAWLDAGIRYQKLANKVLASRDQGHTSLVLAGYGISLRVERDALVVREGATHYAAGSEPRTRVLYRGVHGTERIIVCGAEHSAGAVTFDALRWCRSQGISVVMLGRDGSLDGNLTLEPVADAKLRRGQYLAAENGVAAHMVREIIRRKIAGQRDTLATCPQVAGLAGTAHALDVFNAWVQWFALDHAPEWQLDIDHLRRVEGRLAQVYFRAWEGLKLKWAKADARVVPPHWLVARTRQSPLSWNGRKAVDPLNAVLNYAYGCLEAQCRQALASEGFDVVCGFLHSDKDGRDSLVCDLMELSRPAVDALALGFLARTVLHKGDCTLVSDGSCRLHPQLARAVVASCRVEQGQIDEQARWLRDVLSAPQC